MDIFILSCSTIGAGSTVVQGSFKYRHRRSKNNIREHKFQNPVKSLDIYLQVKILIFEREKSLFKNCECTVGLEIDSAFEWRFFFVALGYAILCCYSPGALPPLGELIKKSLLRLLHTYELIKMIGSEVKVNIVYL